MCFYKSNSDACAKNKDKKRHRADSTHSARECKDELSFYLTALAAAKPSQFGMHFLLRLNRVNLAFIDMRMI